jgi:hypothetical protein
MPESNRPELPLGGVVFGGYSWILGALAVLALMGVFAGTLAVLASHLAGRIALHICLKHQTHNSDRGR